MHTKYIYSPPPPQRNKASAAPMPVSRVGSAAIVDIMSRAICRVVVLSDTYSVALASLPNFILATGIPMWDSNPRK